MDAFSVRTRGEIDPELRAEAAEYERLHGRPPSARTLWEWRQHIARSTRKAKQTDPPTGPERLAAWEQHSTDVNVQILSRPAPRGQHLRRHPRAARRADPRAACTDDPDRGARSAIPACGVHRIPAAVGAAPRAARPARGHRPGAAAGADGRRRADRQNPRRRHRAAQPRARRAGRRPPRRAGQRRPVDLPGAVREEVRHRRPPRRRAAHPQPGRQGPAAAGAPGAGRGRRGSGRAAQRGPGRGAAGPADLRHRP